MPDELADYYLLKLFNFGKSLEEIYKMDMGRLSRALEAGKLATSWERYKTADSKDRIHYVNDVQKIKKLANDG